MAYKLLSFKSADELATAAADDWLFEDLSSRKSPGNFPYLVALSGGRITKSFFGELTRLVLKNWGYLGELFNHKNVHFFWADERCVPPTDAESNFAMAQELLFGPLKIQEARIHRLRGEGTEEVALREGEDAIWALTPNAKAKGEPMLDMVFLGMGEDGHVASLFPGEPEEVMADAAIYRAVTAVKPPPRRITLGYGAIANAANVWVLASGAGKEAALRESLTGGKTPLGKVLQMRSKRSADFTRIYTDIQLPEGFGAGRK